MAGIILQGKNMVNIDKTFVKETGQIKKKSIFSMRKYDLLDLLSIGVYNLIVFSSGLYLGWHMWNVNN
jgi:hypothetical protein